MLFLFDRATVSEAIDIETGLFGICLAYEVDLVHEFSLRRDDRGRCLIHSLSLVDDSHRGIDIVHDVSKVCLRRLRLI